MAQTLYDEKKMAVQFSFLELWVNAIRRVVCNLNIGKVNDREAVSGLFGGDTNDMNPMNVKKSKG
jgi:hypothetical protein